MHNLFFFKQTSEIILSPKDKIVLITTNVNKKKDLLDIFFREFNFPSYFGYNWDSLYDCLSDLNWITNKTIHIIHEDIPLINIETDKLKYINLLFDLANYWAIHSDVHNFLIGFPEKFKHEISAMRKPTY